MMFDFRFSLLKTKDTFERMTEKSMKRPEEERAEDEVDDNERSVGVDEG